MQGNSRRILILATSYLPLIGGAELAVKDLTDRLPDFSFDLITRRHSWELPESERIGNVNVFRVGFSDNAFLGLPKFTLPFRIFSKSKELISKEQYDLIYVLQASQAGGAAWLLKKFGHVHLPIAVNLQEGKDLRRQYLGVRIMRKLILTSADYATVISSYLKKFLIRQGFEESRIFLIPNGVKKDHDFGIPEDLKKELNLTNEKVVITVSRLVEKNGISDLLEGFVHAKRTYAGTLKLVIIGEGELEAQLKKQVQDLGLGSSVMFLGTVPHDQVPRYLALADVFVRPSHSEGLGTAFLEAMAAGVPIIGTPVGGIVDFLEDEKTGLFCMAGDVQDIGQKIVRILSDENLRRHLIKEGKERISKTYDWERIAEKFREFYTYVTAYHTP